MSAVDFVARGVARKAAGDLLSREMRIGTFAQARATAPHIPRGVDCVVTAGHARTGLGGAAYTTSDGQTGEPISAAFVAANPLIAFTASDEDGAVRHFALAEQGPSIFQLGMTDAVNDPAGITSINNLLEQHADRYAMSFPAHPATIQTLAPLAGRSGMRVQLDCELANVTTSTFKGDQPALYVGMFHFAFVSPGWTAGTPQTLRSGTFNPAGNFEMAGGATNDAWFAGVDVGDKLLFLSDAGQEFAIGAGGAGGTGINRECIELYAVTGKIAGSPNILTFDKPAPAGYSAGSLTEVANPGLVDASSGRSYAFLDDVRITGAGGLRSPGINLYKTGCRNLHMDIAFNEGKYGMGGNAMLDSFQRIGTVRATDKAWDIAAASARSRFEFGQMVVLGDGVEDPATGAFNENARWCHVRGRTVQFPHNTVDPAVTFNHARQCSAAIDYLDLPLSTDNVVTFGATLIATNVGGGVQRCQHNSVLLREAHAGSVTNFVRISAVAGLTEDNRIEDGCNFFGRPANCAVVDGGTRSYIGGYYEHGDIDIAGAVDAVVNARLGDGTVLGHSETSAQSVFVNGVQRWPGATYDAVSAASGAVTYTPNAAIGQTGARSFEHRMAWSAATSLTIATPLNAADGQTLRLVIRNANTASLTLTFNAGYLGLPPLIPVSAGKKSTFLFVCLGNSWHCTQSSQDVTFDGETLFSDDFSAHRRWNLGQGVAISGGKMTRTEAAGTVRTPKVAVPRLRASRTYKVTGTVSGQTAGACVIRLGGTGGVNRNSNGTLSETIVAGASGLLEVNFTATSNPGISIDNLSIAEV